MLLGLIPLVCFGESTFVTIESTTPFNGVELFMSFETDDEYGAHAHPFDDSTHISQTTTRVVHDNFTMMALFEQFDHVVLGMGFVGADGSSLFAPEGSTTEWLTQRTISLMLINVFTQYLNATLVLNISGVRGGRIVSATLLNRNSHTYPIGDFRLSFWFPEGVVPPPSTPLMLPSSPSPLGPSPATPPSSPPTPPPDADRIPHLLMLLVVLSASLCLCCCCVWWAMCFGWNVRGDGARAASLVTYTRSRIHRRNARTTVDCNGQCRF